MQAQGAALGSAAEWQVSCACCESDHRPQRMRCAPAPLNFLGGWKLLLGILKYAAWSQWCQVASLWVPSWL